MRIKWFSCLAATGKWGNVLLEPEKNFKDKIGDLKSVAISIGTERYLDFTRQNRAKSKSNNFRTRGLCSSGLCLFFEHHQLTAIVSKYEKTKKPYLIQCRRPKMNQRLPSVLSLFRRCGFCLAPFASFLFSAKRLWSQQRRRPCHVEDRHFLNRELLFLLLLLLDETAN